MAQKEYNDLYKLVSGEDKPENEQTEVYRELMAKETRVLDTVNRLIEQKQKEKTKSGMLLNQSIFSLANNMIITLIHIATELQESNADPLQIFSKQDRLFYLGVFIVLVGILLLLIFS